MVTTLNLKWQKHAEKVLDETCKRGAFVVIDIPTGEVLVLASKPSYDINRWIPRISDEEYDALRDDEEKPLYARAFQGEYPPASTFKPVVALTALNNNVIQEWTNIYCPAMIKIGNKWFHNHSKTPDGSIDVEYALARSNNCWFYQVGIKTGPRAFLSTARRLGYGSVTGLPLHGEASGRVPTEEWVRKKYKRGFTDGDTANYSIGQAWEATPLQVAQMMAGIANGTVLPRLRLIKQIQDSSGNVLSAPEPEARNTLSLDPDAVDVVHKGMHDVVHSGYGTGGRSSITYAQISGKTGTAEWRKHLDQKLAWFAGYVPTENPRLAFAVLYEGDPGEKIGGGRSAGPMVPKFFEHLKDEIEPIIRPPSKALVIVEEGAVPEPNPEGGVLRAIPVERLDGEEGEAIDPLEPLEPGRKPLKAIPVDDAPPGHSGRGGRAGRCSGDCPGSAVVRAGPFGRVRPDTAQRDRAPCPPMDIQIATLCDFAADYNGKMVISGTFDALAAQALPVLHPHCALAMRICLTPEDNGDHKMGITIIDEDGKPIDPQRMPINAEMPVQVPDEASFITRNLVLNFQGLRFPTAGIYSVDVTVDGELMMRIPLRIVQVQGQNQPASPA